MRIQKLDIDNLNELTIIITTYNRHKYLLRSIDYWKNKKVKVIYLDGSKKKLDLNQINDLKFNIKYIHNPVSQYERILNVINTIDTKYVMFGCDDEFYIVSALKSCLKELNNNLELVSCGGMCHGFNFENRKITGHLKDSNLKNINLSQDNYADRIKSHFNNYAPAHIYSICRTEIWKIISEGIFSKEYNFYSAFEFQIEFLICYSGKTKIISELMWLRSSENDPIRDLSPQLMRNNLIERWWYGKKNVFQVEYNDFVSRMTNICMKLNKSKKFESQNVEKNIEIAFISLMNFKKKINYFIYKNHFLQIISNLLKLFLGKQKKFFHFFLDLFFKKEKLLSDQIIDLANKNIIVDFNEVKRIEKIIINFHK